MTREELEKKHPGYEALVDEWRFHIRSYFGGRTYRDGNYLLKHPFESEANYARRKETSYFYNYCGPIVDTFVSHLFRNDARREFGPLGADPLFRAFLKDADLEGNTFRHFMREAQRFASVYGRVAIVVDKPRGGAATRAEAEAFGVRPYVSLVTPENLLDWSYGRDPSTGRPALETIKIMEPPGAYRIWTRQGWELWQTGSDNEAVLADAGEHGLGEVPVVNLYNKQSGIRMIGISDLNDIADINRNIYYLCSDAREIIENTAFPMLAIPYSRGADRGDKEVGPHNILQFDPELPNGRPYWLEAPHSSLTEIREWVRNDIAEIYRIARMGGARATEESAQARSGAALEVEQRQLHSSLSEKADNLEQAETRVIELWAKWEGRAFDGTIDYPDDFSARDIENDLGRAISAQTAREDSETFRKELQKKIAFAVLPKLDEGVKSLISEEIAKA